MKRLNWTGLFIALAWLAADAETGMCLVVVSGVGTQYGVGSEYGDIRRIDVEDDQVVNTSGKLAYGNSPRFSPDGTEFVSINETTVEIRGVDGTLKKSFSVPQKGTVTFTDNGIYLGSAGKIQLFDRNGNKTWEKAFANSGEAFVSKNGKTGSSTGKATVGGKNVPVVLIHDLASGKTISCSDEQGCSGCPSPDGSMVTQNMGGTFDICHKEMRIRNADGTKKMHFALTAVTGLNLANKWCWNSQSWSGNSMDWVLLPVGQTVQTTACSQLDLNCTPWILNINTNQAIRLTSPRTNDWWFPQDYYSGKIYEPPPVELALSTQSLDFAVEAGDANPAAQTVTASTAGGTLQGLTVSDNANWLTVTPAATSGASINLSTAVNIAGLAAGDYNATVTVATTNAGTETYVVNLVVKTGRQFSAVRIDPAVGMAAPGGACRFWAVALDQYDEPMGVQPSFSWKVDSGGTVSNAGVFTAGGASGGPYAVTATSGAVSGTAQVLVAPDTSFHLKVNCGSNDYDAAGWVREDAYMVGGGDWVYKQPVVSGGQPNEAPAEVYKSCTRASPHRYGFPDVTDGDYLLRLHFAVNGNDCSFTYVAEGKTLLKDYNPVTDAGGQYKALVRDFFVQVGGGDGLQLACSTSLQSSGADVFECAIEIQRLVTKKPLYLISPNGGERFEVGDTVFITWGTGTDEATTCLIRVSMDGGVSWPLSLTGSGGLDRADPTWGRFPWVVPATVTEPDGSVTPTVSQECLVQIQDYNKQHLTDVSDAPFTIAAGNATRTRRAVSLDRGFSIRSAAGRGLEITIETGFAPAASVFTLDGRRIDAFCVRHHAGALQYVYPALAPGLYVVALSASGRQLSQRVVIGR